MKNLLIVVTVLLFGCSGNEAPTTDPSVTEPTTDPSVTEPTTDPSVTEPTISPSVTELTISPSVAAHLPAPYGSRQYCATKQTANPNRR